MSKSSSAAPAQQLLRKRQQALENWAKQSLDQINAQGEWRINPLVGDASLRRYFRAKHSKGQSLMLMDSPAVDGSMAQFIDIDQRLIAASVRAPQIYAADHQQGFMLIEDFGDHLLKQELSKNKIDALFSKNILPTLLGLSKCSGDELPIFARKKMQQELDLFSDWHCDQHLKSPIKTNRSSSKNSASDEKHDWRALCELLITTLEEIPQSFIHLDFHSCNLLRIDKENIGVIDFQDARQGPISYDLASWLWDRYISWPRADIERWIEQARSVLAAEIDSKTWLRWCDFTGLQRNLKIVGIFSRLHYRDHKRGYIELMPRFADYCLDTIKRYPELEFCQPLLKSKLKI